MKNTKYILVQILTVLVVLLAGCQTVETPESNNQDQSQQNTTTQIANPWIEYENVQDACESVGFSFNVPNKAGGYEIKGYRVASDLNIIAQIYWTDGDSSKLEIRKAKLSNNDNTDISGDYNEYEFTKTTPINALDVQISGQAEDAINLVTWENGDYGYQIQSDSGLTLQEVTRLVKQIS